MFKEIFGENKDYKENEKEHKEDTIFYKKFKNVKRNKVGVPVDEEAECILAKLDNELIEDDNKDEALKESFFNLSEKLKPGKFYIKVTVSNEVHEIGFYGLEYRGKNITVASAVKKVKSGNIKVEELSGNFLIDKTRRVAGTLNLNFKVPLSIMLGGEGNVEDEHKKLITRQFAGSENYYNRLTEEIAKLRQSPEQTEDFNQTKVRFNGLLQKKGYKIIEINAHNLYSIDAQINGGSHLNISTVDKENWNISIKYPNKRGEELYNLKPQEIITQIESQNE